MKSHEGRQSIACEIFDKVASVTEVHRLWIAIHVVRDYFTRSKARSHSIGPIQAFKYLDSVDPLGDNLMEELPNRNVFFQD